jgi:3-oxoacyl-[acyl-carrier-protein] synthase II
MSSTRVYITGMGLVCCLGRGVDAVFARLCAGECGIRPIDRFDPAPYPQRHAGQLPPELEEELRERFPEEDLAEAMVATAAAEALGRSEAAGGNADSGLGLVLATNFGPMESLEWCWRERLDVGTLDPETFAAFDAFPERLAVRLGCGGPRLQLSLSCASGAAAAAVARDLIAAGRARRVLAVGYDALTEYCWCGLTNLRTITPDRTRPFDANRSGTLFSEGAAAMLLEGADAPPPTALAELAGAATNNNAFHMTAPRKEAEGSRLVMAAAMSAAGIAPTDIDHVCAHATSTRANDVTEAAALRNLFGDHLDRITVAAHKSQLGHMMGAAGIAEAVVTVQAMRAGIIPPTIHHETPDPECRLDCVPGTARKRRFHCALTNSAGLGGNNAALVFRRAEDG